MRDFITVWMAGLLVCGAATAAERTETVPAFEKIEASYGLSVEVVCGNEPSAALSGPEAAIAQVKVGVSGKTLKIERSSRKIEINNDHDNVHVKVTASRPLDSLAISTGVDLKAEACAISSDHLDLTASTGADIKTAAKVSRLVVDASTGADIKPLPGQRIDALETKVHASTGADITLCKAGKLSGSLSLGSDLNVESSDSNDVSTSLGADVNHRDCR